MITKPEGGGSYVRDPATGELTLVERTLHPDEAVPNELAADQPADAAPAATRRAKKEG